MTPSRPTSAPDDAEGAAVPWHSRPFRAVLASTLVLPLGVPLVSPTLPVVRDAFGVGDVAASAVVGAYFLPGIVLSPAVGWALDRLGRRSVLVASLLGFGLVGTAIAGLGSFPAVVAARFVQGTAAAGVFVTTVTVVADSFGGLRRNAVFGINVAVLSTGRALYPVAGGALARYGWNVPFACYLAAVVAGGFVLLTFEEGPRTPRRRAGAGWGGSVSRALAGLPLGPAVGLYGATVAAELVAFGAIMTALPFLLAADFGLSSVATGAILSATTAASAVTAATNGRLARRFSDRRLVAAGFALYGVSLVSVGVAPSPPAVAAAVVPFGAGIGLILPSVDAAISGLVEGRSPAGALGLRNSATGLGRGAGPFVFAAAGTAVGYRPLFVVVGFAAIAGGLGGLLVGRS